MSRRRDFLLGSAATLWAGVLTACGKARTPQKSAHAGVDFVELVPRKPDDKLPLVVAIHGRGGAPEHWIEGWTPFPGNARIALPRGFEKHEEGFSWVSSWPPDPKSEKYAAEISATEERLWKAIAELMSGRRVVVAGFDQGAVLAYVMAARHPDVVAGAFAVAGACPESLLPKNKARAAPLVAYNGTADEVFAIQTARDTVEAFKKQGYDARLREYPGLRHSPSDALHEDLRADMKPLT